MYELIICEKPAAANKIAEALADGKAIKENIQGVPYYKLTHGKKDIVVACAVGHLYGLAEKVKKGWIFPVFDIEWQPVSENSKGAAFTKKYLNTIKKLAKDANEFTVATDFDQEGEVIGLNIVRYLCKKKDANRMKFSTLTKDELRESYNTKSKHIEWGQAESGEARHFLDFYNGINYSRALTAAIKTTGTFKLMSTGRVQGPALKIIVDREKEIKAFVSKPFWQIEFLGEHNGKEIIAWHSQDKFWEKEKADAVIEKTKNQKEAKIDNLDRKQFNQMPPFPFDLTSLQVEGYRCHGISPKEILEIGQELYTSGYISYPRTSSQQLPPAIGYMKVLNDLNKQKQYSDLIKKLLKKSSLKPNNGKKTDPAHPAIYQTGIIPAELTERESKIYDLIVKRFLATFEKYCPKILDEDLTRRFELEMDKIREGHQKKEQLLEDAKDAIIKITTELKKHQKEIGTDLQKANKETQDEMSFLGICPVCKVGNITMRRGKFGAFASCNKYPDCKTIFSIPKNALIKPAKKECEACGYPKVLAIKKARQPMEFCLTPKCPTKLVEGQAGVDAKAIATGEVKRKCPKCSDGDIVLRSSIYGKFYGCSKYPKCRYTEKLVNNNKDKDKENNE